MRSQKTPGYPAPRLGPHGLTPGSNCHRGLDLATERPLIGKHQSLRFANGIKLGASWAFHPRPHSVGREGDCSTQCRPVALRR